MAQKTEYDMMQRPWAILQSVEAVENTIANNKDKLVVILFNLQIVKRGDIEYSLKHQRHKFEESHGTLFFKCIISQIGDKLPKAFAVEDVPTIDFYREGRRIDRLVEPKEDALNKALQKYHEKPNTEVHNDKPNTEKV